MFLTIKSPFEEKKYSFGKKIISTSKGPKNLKMIKTHFYSFSKSLKMELLPNFILFYFIIIIFFT